MHIGRIVAIVGALIGVVGLFFKGATSDGESLLPALNQANPAFPDGLPTVWGGLDTLAQVLVVIAIVAVIGLAVRPPIRVAQDRNAALVTSVLGVALMVYAIVKLIEARDDASALQGAFAEAAAGGAVPQAFTVSTGAGFLVVIIGTALVAVGGVLGLMGQSNQAA